MRRLHLPDFPSGLEERVEVFPRTVRQPPAIPVTVTEYMLYLPVRKEFKVNPERFYAVASSKWLVDKSVKKRKDMVY